jgi:hypothetical protein
MSEKIDTLSSMWLEARRLKEQAKRIITPGGQLLEERLEQRIFEEVDEEIDAQLAARRSLVPCPSPRWEKEWHENEIVLYQAKEKG